MQGSKWPSAPGGRSRIRFHSWTCKSEGIRHVILVCPDFPGWKVKGLSIRVDPKAGGVATCLGVGTAIFPSQAGVWRSRMVQDESPDLTPSIEPRIAPSMLSDRLPRLPREQNSLPRVASQYTLVSVFE